MLWLYVIIMSRKRFRVNLLSIVAWISRNSLLETAAIYSETWNFRYRVCFEQEVPWHSIFNYECKFTLKRIRDMIITYSQMHRTDKYSQHISVIRPVWVNGWGFVYERRGREFESRCCCFNFSCYIYIVSVKGINRS